MRVAAWTEWQSSTPAATRALQCPRLRPVTVCRALARSTILFARRLPAAQDAAIEQCIREYEGIAVWTVTRDATTGAITSVRFPEEDIALAL